ncbi:MAG: DinB family protein [Dehalococcoidia bacterium]
MDFLQLFVDQHAGSHAAAVSGSTEPAVQDRLLSDLSDEQLRFRPARGVNSMAWLLWHMARNEDVVVNVVLAGRLQVREDGWGERLKLAQRDLGTGMSDAEVTDVSEMVDIPALVAYRFAVGRRTQEVVPTLPVEAFDEPIDHTRLLAEGIFSNCAEGERRVGSYWQGQSKRLALGSWITTHNYLHLGEAGCIKTLVAGR